MTIAEPVGQPTKVIGPEVVSQVDTDEDEQKDKEASSVLPQGQIEEIQEVTQEDDEENVMNMLSSRGLNFKMPNQRRATYQSGGRKLRGINNNLLATSPCKKQPFVEE